MPNRAPAPKDRVYRGARDHGDAVCASVIWSDPDGSTGALSPAFHLRYHSPDGFLWGYNGSGPAQLAIALVFDATGNAYLAERVYLRFQREVVAVITADTWELTAEHVANFARTLDGQTVRIAGVA